MKGIELPSGLLAYRLVLTVLCSIVLFCASFIGYGARVEERLTVWFYQKLIERARSPYIQNEMGEERAIALWYLLVDRLVYELEG